MPTLISTLFAASIGCAAAQYVNNNTIGSCADVDCPSRGDSTTLSECQVTNRTYGLIGLQSMSSAITEEDANLTWTVGTHVYDNIDGDSSARKVEKDFYLGTPPSLGLSSDDLPYAGCAIFLYTNELTKPRDNQSSCVDTIGIDCMTSLLTNVAAYLADGSQNGTTSTKETCQRVQEELNKNFPSSCANVPGQESWNGIEAVALTGDDAPKPPPESMNQSSTCHPTLPKSNDLSFVFGYNDTGTVQSESTYSLFYSVNIVLTMFWSPDTTVPAALDVPESHLTCLWPIDLNDEQLEIEEPSTAFHSQKISLVASFLALVVYLL
ncbi:hypothetical protein TW65_04119 [Stemphylium lycopersici]|nr:hypothetical protein TW65_04119 [Stemphylium lycopersici]